MARTSSAVVTGVYHRLRLHQLNVLFPRRRQRQGFGVVFSRQPLTRYQECRWHASSRWPTRSEHRAVRTRSIPRTAVRPSISIPRLRAVSDSDLGRLVARARRRTWSSSVDHVYSLGRDLNTRPRPNQRDPGSRSVRAHRRSSPVCAVQPEHDAPSGAQPTAKAITTAMILGLRKRLSQGVDFSVGYTLERARSTIGTAVDQLTTTSRIHQSVRRVPGAAGGSVHAADAAAHPDQSLSAFAQGRVFRIAPMFCVGRRCLLRSSTAATSISTATPPRFRPTPSLSTRSTLTPA